MHSPIKSFLLVVAIFAAFLPVAFANLVVNPGFETGDFSGWTVTPTPLVSGINVLPGHPHTGTYAAASKDSRMSPST